MTLEGEQVCPLCDHDVAEEHDALGCRGYSPCWPRLVRCDCKLPYGGDDS